MKGRGELITTFLNTKIFTKCNNEKKWRSLNSYSLHVLFLPRDIPAVTLLLCK